MVKKKGFNLLYINDHHIFKELITKKIKVAKKTRNFTVSEFVLCLKMFQHKKFNSLNYHN